MRKAAIDIGTNTTHILIADYQMGCQLIPLFKQRHFTLLAEDGIEQISDLAIGRLFEALDEFNNFCEKLEVRQVIVSATEALRKASNGKQIADNIQKTFGWQVRIISGMEEAQMIAVGVSHAVDLSRGQYLIMDIGGGSVEFVHLDNGVIRIMDSFPLGIAHLYNTVQHTDPISDENKEKLYRHLENYLSAFLNQIGADSGQIQLVGCAGTFEIFGNSDEQNDESLSQFSVSASFFQLHTNRILQMDQNARKKDPFIPPSRAIYIQVALLLIDYVMTKMKITKFIVSKWGLKEGLIMSN